MLSYNQNNVRISNNGRRFALQHYNESITRLAGVLSNANQSIEVILVNCIVFIGLELLLGNTQGAMAHLRCGIRILRTWQERSSDNSSPYSELMGRYLMPIFRHMNLHASAMYGPLALPQPEHLSVRKVKRHEIFKDLVEARAVLLDIMNEGLLLANQRSTFGEKPSRDKAAFQQKQSLLSRGRHWEKAFDALLSEPSKKFLDLQDSQKAALLKLKHKTAKIWIENALNTDEISFDKHVLDFEDIISLAEATFERELELLTGEEYANFSVQMQVISLYYTAIKCRNPLIRRRALALLEHCSRTEGFWDSKMVIKVAQRVMKIEEEGLEGQTDATCLIVPSEWSRIHDIKITHQMVGDSRKALVEFRQRPNGDSRQWLLKREYFM
jgi:hypothetical protein